MDKYRLQSYWSKLRESLLSHKSKELGVFSFFLLLSAGFWLLQTLDETFETDLLVPIELTDVPDDIVITSPLPSHLRVTVKDKGTGLVRYWHHKLDTIRVSFSSYGNVSVSGRVRISQSDIQKALQSRLLGDTKLQAVRPDTLEFYYNHGLHALVPVAIAGEVDTNPHYYLLDVQTSPSMVEVYAMASTLDTLTAVPTVPVNLTDLKENTTIEVDLAPIRGAKIEPSKVMLTANVDVYMENTIEVPIVSLNFPGDKQLRTFPSTVKVTYTVGYSRNRELTRDNFVSLVTYEEILELRRQGKTMLPVQLKTVPEGVTNVRIDPKEVDFLIEDVSEKE